VLTGLVGAIALSGSAVAGGDPRQVMVVANADDADSMAIADHYALSRQLPDGHVCLLSGISPDTTSLSLADYEGRVAPAIDACLAALPDPDAIQVLVTTRGLPYRVDLEGAYVVGFESMLQVHRAESREDGSPLAGQPQSDAGGYYAASVGNPVFIGGGYSTASCDFTVENAYAGSYNTSCTLLSSGSLPDAFDRHDIRVRGTWDFSSNLFIVTRLDGFDADDAMDLVDRAVAGDSTFPEAPLMCMHGADSARGARDPECELVVRMLDLAGLPADWIDTFDGALSGEEVAGYLTGAASMTGAIAGNTFVPGAITDNLTSYGAVPNNFFCDDSGETCPASESQTSVARFVRAGATGAHGTVAEPLNNVFPNASLYLLYSFGYSLGESYLLSTRHVYWQNLVLGDPLATPYAIRPTVEVEADAVAADGVLTVEAAHPDGVAEVAVYVDDLLLASGTGERLEVPAELLGVEGDSVELYLRATAERATVERAGWEVDAWTPGADVRGWRWQTIQLEAPEGPTDSGDPAPDDTGLVDNTDDTDDTAVVDQSDSEGGSPPKGEGCAAAALPAGGLALGLAWLSLAARRRPGFDS